MVVGEGRGGGFSGGLVFGVRFRFFFPVCFSFLFLVFCGGNVVVVVLFKCVVPLRYNLFFAVFFIALRAAHAPLCLPSLLSLRLSIHLLIYTCSSRRACFLSLYLLSFLSPRTPRLSRFFYTPIPSRCGA